MVERRLAQSCCSSRDSEPAGIEGAERNTYWCNFAMVRADYQGKGVARALFELATREVSRPCSSYSARRG